MLALERGFQIVSARFNCHVLTTMAYAAGPSTSNSPLSSVPPPYILRIGSGIHRPHDGFDVCHPWITDGLQNRENVSPHVFAANAGMHSMLVCNMTGTSISSSNDHGWQKLPCVLLLSLQRSPGTTVKIPQCKCQKTNQGAYAHRPGSSCCSFGQRPQADH